MNLPEASPSSSETHSDICSSDSGVVSASSFLASALSERPQPVYSLNSEELELLSHYITHTSRVIPFNPDDLYALHVGIPNLAFGSRPIMGSVLALSAICKCYDVVRHSPAPLDKLDEIKNLLSLADQHHRASLQQIQAAIYDDYCDTVLANAALMVLYALSCHCVRILLAKKARRAGKILSNDMLPLQSQWITSIRAAYVAYIGLRNSTCGDLKDDLPSPTSGAENGHPIHTTAVSSDDLYIPEDGPSEGTKRLLLPIVSATYKTALEKLHAQARTVWIEDSDSSINTREACNSEIQVCLTSLKLLEELFTTVFSCSRASPEPLQPASATAKLPHLGKLDRASPWLRRYLARVTSATPSKVWRRTITAFLNRVPVEYLQLVQSALDCMPVAAEQGEPSSFDKAIPLGPAQQLAMNIFAHWLVLVMHLDGVWWIGNIGQWELGRILAFAEEQRWMPESTETGEAWWPKSMYAVQKAIADPVV